MSNKLSQEELDKIVQIKDGYDKILPEIGSIVIQIDQLEKKLDELKSTKENYLSTYYKILEEESVLSSTLSNKYGSVKVDLSTGEIT